MVFFAKRVIVFNMSSFEMFAKKCFLIRNYRALFITMLFLSSIFSVNLIYAQTATLEIMSVSGDQRDIVEIEVELQNSMTISGLNLNIIYDSLALTPVSISTTIRTASFLEGANVWVAMYDSDVHHVDNGQIRVLAYSGFMPPFATISPGSGAIFKISFLIDSLALSGNSIVEFYSNEPGMNHLSDNLGNEVIPTLINGSVVIGSVVNDAPVFDANNPQSSYNGTAGSQLSFTVTATDANNDSLHLWAEGLPSGANFAGGDGFGSVSAPFSWTPSSNGVFIVTFKVEDPYNSTVSKSVSITIGGGADPEAPQISVSSSWEVTEGDHLEFSVSASDPQGDNITLSASSLPENAEFETVSGSSPVSGLFTFDPDYNQGGSIISVTFLASDGSYSSTKSVTITVIEAPNDILELADRQGALPGSLGRNLIINLRNAEPRYGLQFDLVYDPEVLDINNVIADSTRAFNLFMQARPLEDGYYRILIFTTNPEEEYIPSGSGGIVEFEIDVDNYALPGLSVVTFDSAYTVIDHYGTQQDIIYSLEEGYTIDIVGDANLDGIISIGDCVAIISDILEIIEFNLRETDAADYNRDNGVTIADLMEVVNHIFRVAPEPPGPYSLVGNVELIRDEIFPGFSGEVPLWLSLDTEAAGVQFTIEYDQSEVIFNDIIAGGMVSNLQLDFNDTGGEVKVVVYNFNRSEFGPASGELAKLDIDFIGENPNPDHAIRLKDFEIVDVNAYNLNVEILGELPTSFILCQNYPNPFNASTTISFEMPHSSFVKINIYNVLGQEVKELHAGQLEAGSYRVIWDGKNSDTQLVTSGIYFYRFQADSFNKTKKMLLIK